MEVGSLKPQTGYLSNIGLYLSLMILLGGMELERCFPPICLWIGEGMFPKVSLIWGHNLEDNNLKVLGALNFH